MMNDLVIGKYIQIVKCSDTTSEIKLNTVYCLLGKYRYHIIIQLLYHHSFLKLEQVLPVDVLKTAG